MWNRLGADFQAGIGDPKMRQNPVLLRSVVQPEIREKCHYKRISPGVGGADGKKLRFCGGDESITAGVNGRMK